MFSLCLCDAALIIPHLFPPPVSARPTAFNELLEERDASLEGLSSHSQTHHPVCVLEGGRGHVEYVSALYRAVAVHNTHHSRAVVAGQVSVEHQSVSWSSHS